MASQSTGVFAECREILVLRGATLEFLALSLVVFFRRSAGKDNQEQSVELRNHGAEVLVQELQPAFFGKNAPESPKPSGDCITSCSITRVERPAFRP